MPRVGTQPIAAFQWAFRHAFGREPTAIDASDTINQVRTSLGKRAASTLSAQRVLLITALVYIKQLVLEVSPSAAAELDTDEWSDSLWELFAAAVDRTTAGSVVEGVTASDEEWARVIQAVLQETSDTIESFNPVWWTERIFFAEMLGFMALIWITLSQTLSMSGRASLALLTLGTCLLGLSGMWYLLGPSALKYTVSSELQVTSPAVGNASLVQEVESDKAPSEAADTYVPPASLPLVPPFPPPVAASNTTTTLAESPQVEALRSFIGAEASAGEVAQIIRPVEASPVVIFGVGSAVRLTGFNELIKFNGLGGQI